MAIYAKLMGNPFVDAGVCGICEWLGPTVQPEQVTVADLEQVVNDVAPIMQTDAGWANLHGIFPNSVLTNPAYRKHDQVELLRNECQDYLNTISELEQSGDCIGCGRRAVNTWLSKTNVPLTGSGKLRNFFPTFAEGAGYCSACALAIQLSPLAFVATGGKFLTLHSNSWRALRTWTRRCIADVQSQQVRQEITGCFNPGYKNPRNGLFYMTQEMVQFEEMRTDENVPMQVYCFTNYNQGPELEIFHMPAPVFRFLRYAYQGEFKTAWSEIVRSGYRKVNWAKVKSEEDYKNRPNLVYENLLQGRSILRSFLNQRARKPRGNWELLFLYLNKVRTMKQERLDKLKQVGDFIAKSIRESGRDRRLTQLERAKSYRECRNVLRFVVRDRISQGAQQPLFSIDDYVEHLFPATDNVTFWSETRDLLLFRIYEQLHDWLQTQGFVDFDEDETPGATGSNEENE